MWKINIFIMSLSVFMGSVNCGVYTIIRGQKQHAGEHDVFKCDLGCCGKTLTNWCNNRNADSFNGYIRGCSCQCKWKTTTFLLHIGRCVENNLTRSSSYMDFEGEDCSHFINHRGAGSPLAVVSPAKNYRVKTSSSSSSSHRTSSHRRRRISSSPDYRRCSVKSVVYLADGGIWHKFTTNSSIFTMSQNNLNVGPTITIYENILGRIVKLTLKDCPKGTNGCLVFKVAGNWTYDNSTSATPSILKPSSTMLLTATPTFESPSSVPSQAPLYTSDETVTQATTVHFTPQFSLVPSVWQLSSSSEEPFVTDVLSSTQPVAVETLQSMRHTAFTVSSDVGVISIVNSVNSVARMTPTEYIPNTSNPKHSARSGGSDGAAVGGGVAAVVLLIIVVLVAVYIVRKRKKNRPERPGKFPALNNPAYMKGSSLALEKSNTASIIEDDYIPPFDGGVNKPYKSLVKKHPVNAACSDEEYTYATGDSLPQEPHYQGLVKGKASDAQEYESMKGQSQEPSYNELEGPNSSIMDSGRTPIYDVLEDSSGQLHGRGNSDSQAPSRPRYTKPPKSTKVKAPGVGTESASTAMYDVLEGPNPDNNVSPPTPSQAPLYDVLEGPNPVNNDSSSVPSQTPLQEDQNQNGREKSGSSTAPLYDVLDGPEPIPATSPHRGSTPPTDGVSDQTYEALQPTRESIYQPLDQGFDDYDNVYQSVGDSSA